jgi:Co/Zn/Cd efflux system component
MDRGPSPDTQQHSPGIPLPAVATHPKLTRTWPTFTQRTITPESPPLGSRARPRENNSTDLAPHYAADLPRLSLPAVPDFGRPSPTARPAATAHRPDMPSAGPLAAPAPPPQTTQPSAQPAPVAQASTASPPLAQVHHHHRVPAVAPTPPVQRAAAPLASDHPAPACPALIEALRLLWIALVLKVAIVVVELYGAAESGSLAMLADAIHLSIDVFAISAAIYAARLALRPGNLHAPGTSPAEIAAVRINGVVLLVAGVELVTEAFHRLSEPPELGGMGLAIGIALFRFAVSFTTAQMLARGARENLNLKAVHMHATADMISSCALIVSALLVASTGAVVFDSLLSVAVGIVILRNGWSLLAHSSRLAAALCPGCDAPAAARA